MQDIALFAIFSRHFTGVVGGGVQVKYLFLLSRDPPTCAATPASGFQSARCKNNRATLIQIITSERHSPSS